MLRHLLESFKRRLLPFIGSRFFVHRLPLPCLRRRRIGERRGCASQLRVGQSLAYDLSGDLSESSTVFVTACVVAE